MVLLLYKPMTQKLLLKGMGVSRGKAEGSVCIVLSPSDYAKLHEGDILVTRMTDPSMTIIINRCAGIICDIGGMTSHPAIISRELGIPAIVAATNATTILTDGMKVSLDGATGEIFSLID